MVDLIGIKFIGVQLSTYRVIFNNDVSLVLHNYYNNYINGKYNKNVINESKIIY